MPKIDMPCNLCCLKTRLRLLCNEYHIGLPVEFYRKMWPIIKLDFLEMVKEVRNTKNLSDSQKKGVIRLIFKKEDRYDLKFYRPISLLNVHVKIITKTLLSFQVESYHP